MRHLESRLQMSCVRWFKIQYPELAPLLFAVPNGGKRNAREAGRLKAEGVTPGVADLILLKPSISRDPTKALICHGLCLELKTDQGKLSTYQKTWSECVQRHGYRYEVIRSVDQFVDTVRSYLND